MNLDVRCPLNRNTLPPGEYERITKKHAAMWRALERGKQTNVALAEDGLDFHRGVRAIRKALRDVNSGLTVVKRHVEGAIYEYEIAREDSLPQYRVSAEVSVLGTPKRRMSIIVRAVDAGSAKNQAQHMFAKVGEMTVSTVLERTVDLADVYGYGPSAPGWKEPAR